MFKYTTLLKTNEENLTGETQCFDKLNKLNKNMFIVMGIKYITKKLLK